MTSRDLARSNDTSTTSDSTAKSVLWIRGGRERGEHVALERYTTHDLHATTTSETGQSFTTCTTRHATGGWIVPSTAAAFSVVVLLGRRVTKSRRSLFTPLSICKVLSCS
jgi:hypothetical protein